MSSKLHYKNKIVKNNIMLQRKFQILMEYWAISLKIITPRENNLLKLSNWRKRLLILSCSASSLNSRWLFSLSIMPLLHRLSSSSFPILSQCTHTHTFNLLLIIFFSLFHSFSFHPIKHPTFNIILLFHLYYFGWPNTSSRQSWPWLYLCLINCP